MVVIRRCNVICCGSEMVLSCWCSSRLICTHIAGQLCADAKWHLVSKLRLPPQGIREYCTDHLLLRPCFVCNCKQRITWLICCAAISGRLDQELLRPRRIGPRHKSSRRSSQRVVAGWHQCRSFPHVECRPACVARGPDAWTADS